MQLVNFALFVFCIVMSIISINLKVLQIFRPFEFSLMEGSGSSETGLCLKPQLSSEIFSPAREKRFPDRLITYVGLMASPDGRLTHRDGRLDPARLTKSPSCNCRGCSLPACLPCRTCGGCCRHTLCQTAERDRCGGGGG